MTGVLRGSQTEGARGKDTCLSVPELYVATCYHADVFIPLTGEQRTCPGQQFALTNAAYALVRICQKFVHIESFDEPGRERRMTFGLAQLHMDGVKVRFT